VFSQFNLFLTYNFLIIVGLTKIHVAYMLQHLNMSFSRKGIFFRSLMSQIYFKRLLHIVASMEPILIEHSEISDLTINLQGEE
jgi:hypothetical protein